jgi:hypothetical protein
MNTSFVYGPTFAEMRDPPRIKPEVRKQALEMKRKDLLDPINHFNIARRSSQSPNQKVLHSFPENWSHN